jgi:hypothetical protein
LNAPYLVLGTKQGQWILALSICDSLIIVDCCWSIPWQSLGENFWREIGGNVEFCLKPRKKEGHLGVCRIPRARIHRVVLNKNNSVKCVILNILSHFDWYPRKRSKKVNSNFARWNSKNSKLAPKGICADILWV